MAELSCRAAGMESRKPAAHLGRLRALIHRRLRLSLHRHSSLNALIHLLRHPNPSQLYRREDRTTTTLRHDDHHPELNRMAVRPLDLEVCAPVNSPVRVPVP